MNEHLIKEENLQHTRTNVNPKTFALHILTQSCRHLKLRWPTWLSAVFLLLIIWRQLNLTWHKNVSQKPIVKEDPFLTFSSRGYNLLLRSLVLPTVTDRNYTVIFYIRSAPREQKMRDAVRDTWYREARKLCMIPIFVLAATTHGEVRERVALESQEHGDMIEFSGFDDAYVHLSLKTREIMSLHAQIERKTPHPVILVWTNLDGFFYPENLMLYIDQQGIHQMQKWMFGYCTCTGKCDSLRGPVPFRTKGHKWYMPHEVWPFGRYPHYCMGYALVMSPGCAQPLYEAAKLWTEQNLKIFWIDDVLFTGVLRLESNISSSSRLDLFPFGSAGIYNCTKCVAMHVHNKPTALYSQWEIYKNETEYRHEMIRLQSPFYGPNSYEKRRG